MSAGKIGFLVVCAVLAGLAITRPGTQAGDVALWILLALAVAHVIEMLVFLPLARKAGGSLPGHLLQLFLFGVLHVKELKAAVAANG